MKSKKGEPELRLTPFGQGLLGGLIGGFVVAALVSMKATEEPKAKAPAEEAPKPVWAAHPTRRMSMSMLTPAYTPSDPEPASPDNPWSVANASDGMVSAAYELRELREALKS